MGLRSFLGWVATSTSAVADAEPVFHGFNVDVGGAQPERVHQHLLYQADDGGVPVLSVDVAAGVRKGHVPVEFLQAAFHRTARGYAENYVAAQQLGQAVHGFQVQRIVNGHINGKAVVGNRNGAEAPGQFRTDDFPDFLGYVHGSQVHYGKQGIGGAHLRDDVFREVIGLNEKINQVLGGRFLAACILKNLFIQIPGLRKKFDEI